MASLLDHQAEDVANTGCGQSFYYSKLLSFHLQKAIRIKQHKGKQAAPSRQVEESGILRQWEAYESQGSV